MKLTSGNMQQTGIQLLATEAIDEMAALAVPTVFKNFGVDLRTQRTQAVQHGRIEIAVRSVAAQEPIHPDPGHDNGIGIALRAAARFPKSVPFVSPRLLQLLHKITRRRDSFRRLVDARAGYQVEGVEQFANHVDLPLCRGIVAGSHGRCALDNRAASRPAIR